MTSIVLIAHNLRSTHNVGSLLRTCEGLGVGTVYLTGYTPYPKLANDSRLPHMSKKLDDQIHKTALDAERLLNIKHAEDIEIVISELKGGGYKICGLEQGKSSMPLNKFKPPEKVALIVGREVEGIEPEVLVLCDQLIEIPMFGQKESFNVVQAAAMALYQLRFYS
jgi:23S rRNA (guanosine2251-2'-O)-methyltransferase